MHINIKEMLINIKFSLIQTIFMLANVLYNATISTNVLTVHYFSPSVLLCPRQV